MATRTWDWDQRAEREFNNLSVAASAKLAEVIQRYLDDRHRPGEVQGMPGHKGLWEVRAQAANGWPRVLFTKTGEGCRGLTAFMKKSNRTGKRDIDRATRRM